MDDGDWRELEADAIRGRIVELEEQIERLRMVARLEELEEEVERLRAWRAAVYSARQLHRQRCRVARRT